MPSGLEREAAPCAHVNVMADTLLNQYDKALTPFHYIHVTTNLSDNEVEQFYSTRVRSHIYEMFNINELQSENRRI